MHAKGNKEKKKLQKFFEHGRFRQVQRDKVHCPDMKEGKGLTRERNRDGLRGRGELLEKGGEFSAIS